ncbi:MAG: hypothetical protein K2I69_00960 [Muribaculaceae bacterium]|nr:hypothetical protein [Muribaculaceae bacterium]
MNKKTLLLFSLLSLIAGSASADDNDFKKYIPEVHGTFRGLYALSTENGQSRFYVANARLSAAGYVLPFADYYVQVDLCNQGKISILDCYGILKPAKGLQIMAGQTRVPLCIEATRSPHAYVFNNLASTVTFGNLRSVGIKAGYKVPGTTLYAEGGVFNATDMTDHSLWNSALTYSVKMNIATSIGLIPEIGFMSRVPGGYGKGVRLNQPQASLVWKSSHWDVEAEYVGRAYAGGKLSMSHSYFVFADYGFDVNTKWANRISVQGRFDGITKASNGLLDAAGEITETIPAYRRITLGTTASYKKGIAHVDFRINYEQYFYDDDDKPASPSFNNQINAGLTLYF